MLNDGDNSVARNSPGNSLRVKHVFWNDLISQLPDLTQVCRGTQNMNGLFPLAHTKHLNLVDIRFPTPFRKQVGDHFPLPSWWRLTSKAPYIATHLRVCLAWCPEAHYRGSRFRGKASKQTMFYPLASWELGYFLSSKLKPESESLKFSAPCIACVCLTRHCVETKSDNGWHPSPLKPHVCKERAGKSLWMFENRSKCPTIQNLVIYSYVRPVRLHLVHQTCLSGQASCTFPVHDFAARWWRTNRTCRECRIQSSLMSACTYTFIHILIQKAIYCSFIHLYFLVSPYDLFPFCVNCRW